MRRPRPSRCSSLALLAAAWALFLACDRSPTEPCQGPYRVGGEVSPPLRISAPQPQYTELARQARIQGVVIVQAIIDCEGAVTSIKVLKELPMGLTESAVEAISRWRFEPARLNGSPVSVFYNLTVNFRIQ
jgi:periplasmic protein TonB